MWITGVGVHSGRRSSLSLWPVDRPGIFITCEAGSPPDLGRSKRLGADQYDAVDNMSFIRLRDARIACPEHLLGSLVLADIGAVLIQVEPRDHELPLGPDGKESFYDLLLAAGRVPVPESAERVPATAPWEPVAWREDSRRYSLVPSSTWSIVIALDWLSETLVESTLEGLPLTADAELTREIARSRTFVKAVDLPRFEFAGLCAGVRDNPWCMVLETEDLESESTLRECARHKVLDLLGDLALLGPSSPFSLSAFNPGHVSNVKLLRLLSEQRRSLVDSPDAGVSRRDTDHA